MTSYFSDEGRTVRSRLLKFDIHIQRHIMNVFASALEGAAKIRDQFTGWQHIRLCPIALSTEECVSFHVCSNRVACNSGKNHCRRALRARRGRSGIIYFHSCNGLTHWGSFQNDRPYLFERG